MRRTNLQHTSSLDNNPGQKQRVASPSAPGPSFAAVLMEMARRPQKVLLLWNWKSALLSIILRGPIFLVAAIRQGWEAAIAAVLAESVFCAVTAGFYGALVQTLKDAEPQWLTGFFLAVVLPIVFQIFEYVLHRVRGTPHLRIAEIVSVIISALSALFNWYAMRRGTLLVGGEGGSFGGDLARLPRLLYGFVALLPRRLAGKTRNSPFKVSSRFSSEQRSDLFLGS